MARIIGGGGKAPSQTVGRPGFKQFVGTGAPRKRVGLVQRAAQRGVTRLLRRDPAKFQGEAPFGGPLTFASITTALTGANNDLVFTAQSRGNPGNLVRVRYVVSGTNTALSVSVSGNDITVNVATNGGGAATSTAAQVLAAVNASTPAKALVVATLASGNSGAGVVTAMGFQTLAGGQQPEIQGGDGQSNPNVVKAPVNQAIDLANARGGKKVVDRSANRSIKHRAPGT